MLESCQTVYKDLRVDIGSKPIISTVFSLFMHCCLLLIFLASIITYHNNIAFYTPVYVELEDEATMSSYDIHSNVNQTSSTSITKKKAGKDNRKKNEKISNINYETMISNHLTKVMRNFKDSQMFSNQILMVKLYKNGEVINYGFKQKVTEEIKAALSEVIQKANPFPRPPASELQRGYVQYALKIR